MSGIDRDDFEAKKENGVYLVEVESAYEGYIFYSTLDYTLVENVRINGHYVATSESFETECDDFEFTDGGAVNLLYQDTDSDQAGGGS